MISKRTGTITYTQEESGNPARVELEQKEAVITTEYKLDVYPLGFEWTAEDTSIKELSVNSFKVYYLNGKETSRVKIGYRVYRENIIGDKDKFDILPDKSGFNVSPCGMNFSSNEYYMDFEIIQNESNQVSQTIVLSQLSY